MTATITPVRPFTPPELALTDDLRSAIERAVAAATPQLKWFEYLGLAADAAVKAGIPMDRFVGSADFCYLSAAESAL